MTNVASLESLIELLFKSWTFTRQVSELIFGIVLHEYEEPLDDPK